MINALVTKNGQSALISLPAKRIGLARDLASIGVASPPSELYPHDDELTVGLKYFGTDDFSDRLITLIQSEDSLARVNTLVELYGDLPVAQREKVKASILSGEMTSLNDFKNSILENKSPEIVQNYYCDTVGFHTLTEFDSSKSSSSNGASYSLKRSIPYPIKATATCPTRRRMISNRKS